MKKLNNIIVCLIIALLFLSCSNNKEINHLGIDFVSEQDVRDIEYSDVLKIFDKNTGITEKKNLDKTTIRVLLKLLDIDNLNVLFSSCNGSANKCKWMIEQEGGYFLEIHPIYPDNFKNDFLWKMPLINDVLDFKILALSLDNRSNNIITELVIDKEGNVIIYP